jgi:hypothetical protein
LFAQDIQAAVGRNAREFTALDADIIPEFAAALSLS